MHFSPAFVIAALPFLGLITASPTSSDSSALPDVNTTTASISLSKRISLLSPAGIVDFLALKSHVSRTTFKLGRGLAAYERNTGTRHSLAVAIQLSGTIQANTNIGSYRRKRASKGQGKKSFASNKLTDANEALWFGTIEVGTPPVKYTVDFDTGSSDLFLPASSCESSCQGHTKYDPSASHTSKNLSKSFSLSYGDGSSVSGTQFTDTVSIAGLTADTQTLGAASNYSSGFTSDSFPADGLMGMGFQSISDYNAPPLFQSLVAAKAAKEPVFAFKLSTDEGAELTLGGLNSALYKGDVTYVPVKEKGYWQIQMDSVNVGDKKPVSSMGAIVDSGTTLIVGDSKNVKAFYDAVPGAKPAPLGFGNGYYTVPCNAIPSDISLTFGGKSFGIKPEVFNLGQVQQGSEDCVGGVVGEDLGVDFWIVGDVFMRNVYTVFDYGKSQVGFADLA